LGANFLSTGAGGTPGSITTGQFPGMATNDGKSFTLTDALNVFLFRPDLNLAATIRALETKRQLETLAEPTVPAINGKTASFLAGGEFPFPMIQGGASVGAVTIQFREFGVRLSFLPTVTPRGTIRLQVTPEVSSLDFANGLVFQGFNIPAISTRRVQTEIELENGQSFAIAGLLDNRVTESWSKIPGLGDIPLFGKLFQSKSRLKNNTELLIVVTPELVRPVPAGPRAEVSDTLPGVGSQPTAEDAGHGCDRSGSADGPQGVHAGRRTDSKPAARGGGRRGAGLHPGSRNAGFALGSICATGCRSGRGAAQGRRQRLGGIDGNG
jgi:pilus assembly protein CpaC